MAEKSVHKQPNYLGVFAALVMLTAIEIAITYLPLPRIPFLVPLAFAKASLVALYFMHLKFDQKVFRLVFVFGVVMGLGLVVAMTLLFAPPLLDLK